MNSPLPTLISRHNSESELKAFFTEDPHAMQRAWTDDNADGGREKWNRDGKVTRRS